MKHLVSRFRLTPYNDLDTLVENRTTYSVDKCELNMYETYRPASNVVLQFNDFVFTSMLRGKKEMTLPDKQQFDYFPGESVIVSPGERMQINFPEADAQNPTQCIALRISDETITETINYLNERHPLVPEAEHWNISPSSFFLLNSASLATATEHIIKIITEQNAAKDVITGFALKELLVRLMQTQARTLFEDNYRSLSASHRFGHVVLYIKQHLHENISIETLSKMAYMSKPNFFRIFKRQFGISPGEFIMHERVKAAKKLLSNACSVTEAAYQLGFSDANYFIRVFKQVEGVTPKCYQKQKINLL